MKFRGWTIDGPSYVRMREFDTEVGRGLISTDDPEFEKTPRIPLADDCVIVKNLVSSICGSDKWLFPLGGDQRRPRGCQFGHEVVSEVIEVGKDVTDLKVGQRVSLFPYLVKESRAFAGRPGGYSELIVVEQAKKNYNLYPISDSVSDATASMFEPSMVGFRSAEVAAAQPGKKVVVIGAGPIGLTAAINLREKGVEDVLILNRSRNRLEIAKNVDKKQPFEILSTLDEGWQDKLFERFGERMTQTGRAIDVDLWIDAAGSKSLFEEIYSLTSMFTTMSVVSVFHENVSLDLRKLTWSGVTLQGSAGYQPPDAQNVIKAMESGRYDFDSLVTATFPFEQVQEALEFVQDGSKVLKAQIDFRL